MTAAAAVRINIPLIIGGEEIKTTNQYPVNSHIDPNAVIHNFSTFNIKDSSLLDMLYTSAKTGFEEWSTTPYDKKIKIFQKAIALLNERKSQLFDSHSDIGGPAWFAGFNVDGAIGQIEEYISHLSNPIGVVPQSLDTELALTIKQPIGPVLAIAPWNAPVILASRSIVAPLAAGCSVIHKTSEKSPLASYLFVKCFHDAGLPKDALQLVHVSPQDNPQFLEQVLSSGVIKKLNFTGSTAVGKKIAAAAASHLVPCLLELGGKNYSLVRKDADLSKAVPNIIWSSWSHKGQICMSTEKVYVHEDIYDTFKGEVLKLSSEISKDSDYAIPQRDLVFTKKIIDLVDDAVDKGAQVLFGDYNKDEYLKNNSISPLIIEGVTEEMLLDTTESFGPIFTIHKYSDEDKLIKQLNDSPYGLKASIWSQDIMKALSIAKRIEIGGIHINHSTVHDEATIPHGGVKSSGHGRFNSSWGIDEFSILKSITIN
ncbi:mitochondrial aldehyde dehydrogenase [Scheffersomyces coipomensis]|uniref:mitochondrial aldehyde dehydrogenase n=1 Tax=Scheffersomyces coipomensis TaxID=1788519 RepID=UPI00315C58C9